MQPLRHFIKDSFPFLFLSFISFLSFSILGFFVYTQNETLLHYNYFVYTLFQQSVHQEGLLMFEYITALGSPLFMVFLLLLLVTYSLYKKRYDESVIYVLGGVGGAGFVFLLKHALGIARPVPYAIVETGNSFPSGHTTLSFLVAFLICYFFIRDEKIHRRFLFILTASFYSVLIAYSRLYLGVHWLTDVLGGFLLGFTFLSFSFVVDIFIYYFLINIKKKH